MRKAARIVLKRDGYLIVLVVLFVAISEYLREAQITIGGLFAAALISTAITLITKVPGEIRKLEATRELL